MPAAPVSSSSEGHVGDFSRSAWEDDGGAAYQHFLLPDQFANNTQDPSWWSPESFLDASPPQQQLPLDVDDIDWTFDEEQLQQAITTAAAETALTTIAPEPPVPATSTDWSGFGMFDSNLPTVGSTSSGASSHPTPAMPAFAYPRTNAQRKHIDPELLLKRQRNKVAAQKYRQKKLDRISELELEVTDIKRERDELRIKLVKQEAETAALREMLRLANPGTLNES